MDNAEIVTFESRSPPTYNGLLSGDAGPAEQIRGFLVLPKRSAAGGGKPPVVVICIGSQGFESGRETLYSGALSDAGIAAFVVDSFSPRGFTETASAQGRLSMAGSASDALHAVAHLRSDSRIDGARIGILGYSRGGNVVMSTHHRGLQQAVLGDPDTILAHAAIYPSVNPQWRNPRPTRAPLLMLLGEADDLAPAPKSRAYAARISAAGGQIEVIGFADAHHGFDSLRPATHQSVSNLSRCMMMIEDDGSITEDNSGLRAGSDWGDYLNRLQQACGGTGGTVGHGPGARTMAVGKVQDFFSAALAQTPARR